MLRDLSALQIVLAIAGVGLLIAWHELGHYTLARLLGMRVLKYSIGFGPALLKRTIGGIDYQVSAFPLGGYVQIKGMVSLEPGALEDPKSFVNRPRWARWLVLAAGPGFNYMMAAALFFAVAAFWPSPLETPVVEVSDVVPDSPAAAAGIRAGDMIAAVDGVVPNSTPDFKRLIAAKAGAPVTLDVLRDGARSDVLVTPAAIGSDFRIGVAPSYRLPDRGLIEGVAKAVIMCRDESERTLMAFAALAKREPGVQVQGPVKIVAEMKEQISKGGRFFLYILAILSVNLGLFNLLPVPSLDGIKMLFLTVEGIVRRDLNATMQVWVNAIGLLALLGLMALLMVKETFQLFS